MGARPEDPCGQSLGECIQWIQSCEAAFGGVEPLFAVLDPDGTVAYAARSVERTLGRSPGELLGVPLVDVVHPDDSAVLAEAVSEAADRRGVQDRHVVRLAMDDGSWQTHVLSVRHLDETLGVDGLVVSHHGVDATAASVFEAAPIGVTISDGVGLDGPVTFVNDGVLSLVGAEADDVLGGSVARLFASTTEVAALEASAADSQSGTTTAELRLAANGEHLRWCRVDVVSVSEGEDSHTVVFYRDATDTRHDRQALDSLHETARELLASSSVSAVSARAVESIDRILSVPVGVFLQYEPRDEQLTPVAVSNGAPEQLQMLAPIPVTDGLLGEVFVSGWGRYLTDVDETESFGLDTSLESALLLPVGNHGLLLVGCPDRELGRTQRDLARVLADVVELALGRISRAELVDSHEQELDRQRAELAELVRINELIRDVNRALVHVGQPEEILQVVCQQLADSEPVVFAWFGPHEPLEACILPSSWAGVSGTYVDRFTTECGEHPMHRLALQAVESGRIAVADSVHDHPEWEAVRSETLRYGFQSVAAVPVGYRDTIDGVLVVGDARPTAFDDRLKTVYEELGDVVGSALFRAQMDAETTSEQTVLIQVQVADDDCLLNRLSRELDCNVQLEGLSSVGAGVTQAYVQVVEGTAEAVASFLEREQAVRRVTPITTDDGPALFGVVFESFPVLQIVTERNGRIQSFETHDGVSDVSIEFPVAVDVRAAVEAIQTIWPETTFQSRREQTGTPETPGTLFGRLRDELTERQFDALRNAFYGGFYDWPRASSNDQLAAVMGISSPTFQHHRRVAERKLLELLFDQMRP